MFYVYFHTKAIHHQKLHKHTHTHTRLTQTITRTAGYGNKNSTRTFPSIPGWPNFFLEFLIQFMSHTIKWNWLFFCTAWNRKHSYWIQMLSLFFLCLFFIQYRQTLPMYAKWIQIQIEFLRNIFFAVVLFHFVFFYWIWNYIFWIGFRSILREINSLSLVFYDVVIQNVCSEFPFLFSAILFIHSTCML